MLEDLHLELVNPHTFKESKYNGDTSVWTVYNESMHEQIFEPLTFYVARLSDEIKDFEPAGIYKDEMEATYNVIKDFLNSFDWRNASDRVKVEKAAPLVCQSNYIDTNEVTQYRPYGCLVKKAAVCDGFAYSFSILTRLMGMESFYEPYKGHGMNGIKIDGQWYQFDGSASCGNMGSASAIISPADVTIDNGIAKINSYNMHSPSAYAIKIK